ncbi:MAG: hypothetical protein ABFC28_09690 [Rikenellaceae bacterium]
MKLFSKLFDKEKKPAKPSASVEQQGENSISVIGNVEDSYIGCSITINDIEPQWQDRLKSYTATLQQFKPKTALSLLEKLEESFITSSKKPSQEFCSLVSFQKGMCYRFLDERNKMCECFIAAYSGNSSVPQFEEQAALSYFKIEDTTKANELVDKLLRKNEYNPIAWYIKFLSNTTYDFNSIPAFVRQNVMFQQMLYNYFNVKNLYDCISRMKEFSMLPDVKDYNPQDVTITNFDESIFYSNVFFSDYLHDYYFTFHCLNEGNIGILKTLDLLLTKLVSVLNSSELEKKYGTLFFLNAYVQYILTKELRYISEMRNHYLKLESKNDILALLCANVLQLNEQIDFALEILNDSKLNQSNIFFLKAYCFLKKNDKIKYGVAIKDWVNSIEKIDNSVVDSYLASIFTLKGIGETDELKLSDFIQNKKFENQELKTLVETIVNSLISGLLDSQQLSTLEGLVSDTQQPKLLLYIADTYYYCKVYGLAVDLYKKYVDRDMENRELFFYINSLYAAKKDSDELLGLLEKWRLNFSIQPDLLRIEADLCVILHNWNRCLEICNCFLKEYPQSEAFLSLKLRCLDAINEDWCDNEIKSMAKTFVGYSFKITQNIPVVATILVNRGCFIEGLEIFYIYSENKDVRSSYLFATLTYSHKSQNKEILKEFDEIIDGCFVKYEFNGEINFFEMNKKNSDNLYDKLLGHKVGDIISIKRMSNKDYSIRVLRITDKYLYLHDKILEEAKQPLSGLPMESFSFTSTEPDGMKQDLIALFGQQGEEEKIRRETAIKNYYNRELSFTEVIIQAFRNEYLGGYTSLIYEHSGILILPLPFYESLPQPVNRTNFVIDFSSLVILYQIAKEHNITYPHKFLISVFTIDMIRRELRKIQLEPKSELSVVVTNEGISKYQIPENAQQNNIIYLEGLLKWIQENCESAVSSRVIDFKRNIPIDDTQNDFIDYILNTLLVYEDKQGILLTDDFVYFKFKLAQVQFSMSTEQYVKSVLEDEHPALFEFIKNKYKSFTLSTKQLLDEFNKKMNFQDNYYANCLENISMASAIPCTKLINAVTQSQLEINQQEIEIKNVFVNMLKSSPLSNAIIQNFEMLIFLELKYSQEKLNFVGRCLEDVYQMLGITKNE